MRTLIDGERRFVVEGAARDLALPRAAVGHARSGQPGPFVLELLALVDVAVEADLVRQRDAVTEVPGKTSAPRSSGTSRWSLYSFSASHCGCGELTSEHHRDAVLIGRNRKIAVGGSVDTSAVKPSSPSQPQSLFVLRKHDVECDLKIRLRLMLRLAFRFMRSSRDFSNTPSWFV